MFYTEELLQDAIRNEGVDKIIFHVPMRPLHFSFGLPMAMTYSNDDLVQVPCKIVDSNNDFYNPLREYPYKIKVKSLFSQYGSETFYFMDFVSLLNQGTISIRGMSA